jgi:hypothetical protein
MGMENSSGGEEEGFLRGAEGSKGVPAYLAQER